MKSRRPTAQEIEAVLMPAGSPASEKDMDRLFDLYKLMVDTSEALVGRRQGLNTFFLTLNGALLTGIGLVLRGGGNHRLLAGGILTISMAGAILSIAWQSLLKSFGQLNTGKFAVINCLEQSLPAAIFAAEWKALAEGKDKKVYRSFTAREAWAPYTTLAVYVVSSGLSASVIFGWWRP